MSQIIASKRWSSSNKTIKSGKKGKRKNKSNIKLLNPHRHSPGTQHQHMNQEGQTELQVTLLKEKQQYKTH